MMRKMISRLLTPPGHVIVGEAKNGLEAVDMYSELKPDIVTMDITMRGMDGVTAAKEILSKDQAARIIFLSNLDDRIPNGSVPMRVILHGVSNDIGDLVVTPILQLLHRVENAPLHWFQSIIGMGNSSF